MYVMRGTEQVAAVYGERLRHLKESGVFLLDSFVAIRSKHKLPPRDPHAVRAGVPLLLTSAY